MRTDRLVGENLPFACSLSSTDLEYNITPGSAWIKRLFPANRAITGYALRLRPSLGVMGVTHRTDRTNPV